MITYLKIKAATLTFESKAIRNKERHTLANARALAGIYRKKHGPEEEPVSMPEKTRRALATENSAQMAEEAYDLFWGLQHHRKNVVRKEARDTHIALHFLRGKSYSTVEHLAFSQPDWDNIERMILTYAEEDPRVIKQRYEEWCQDAEAHLQARLTQREK
jgi:hypothetical protein